MHSKVSRRTAAMAEGVCAPVEGTDEVLLQAALYEQHEEVHDRFGHTVLEACTHDVIVALHQQARDGHLHALLLAHALRHPQSLHASHTPACSINQFLHTAAALARLRQEAVILSGRAPNLTRQQHEPLGGSLCVHRHRQHTLLAQSADILQ